MLRSAFACVLYCVQGPGDGNVDINVSSQGGLKEHSNGAMDVDSEMQAVQTNYHP